MTKNEKYRKVIEYFSVNMPEAKTELNFQNPFQLLIAVVLSAQCTDKRVNMITPGLFEKYKTPDEMAEAGYDNVFNLIKSCSYPNSKSKYIVDLSKELVKKFNSKVPSEIDDLMQLPGVGRKTANVVSAVVFNKPAMPVDTHIFRVSMRIGLIVNAKNPLDAEKQLVKHFPQDKINIAHNWLVLHGRYVCIARKPKCNICGITSVCDYYRKVVNKNNLSV